LTTTIYKPIFEEYNNNTTFLSLIENIIINNKNIKKLLKNKNIYGITTNIELNINKNNNNSCKNMKVISNEFI
jgi:hypothetical protein